MPTERLVSLAAGTILDVGPAEAVSVAAQAGWPAVGVWFDPASWTDTTTAEVRRRLDDTGLVALDIEPVILGPDGDPGDRLIDVAAEIGARHVLVASRWDDPIMVTDRFAALCDRAAPHDITVVLEFLPIFGIRTLSEAVQIVSAADRPNGGVLVDTLHLSRSGGSPADLAAVDPALLPYLQVADAPAAAPADLASLVDEARYGRLLPGEGVLPIRDVIEAVPMVPLSFELRSRLLHQTYPDAVDRAVAVMQNWLEFSSGHSG
jgi:sugar phosphate isomerase/epimerase